MIAIRADASPPDLIADIELPASPVTSGVSPRWSEDGARLFVERSVDPRWWPWLDEHQADVGAAVGFVGLVIACWWIVRTWRRPRRAGRRYCRRCNYDVTGGEPGSSMPETCPECGRAGGPRLAVRGRWLPWRVVTVGLPAAGIAVAGAIVWWSSITTRPTFAGSSAWPAAVCGTWSPRWPLWRRPSRRRFAFVVDVFEVTDSVQLLRNVALEGSRNWDVTAEGSVVAWTEQSERTGWALVVRWVDVTTGAEQSVEIGPASMGFITLSGFTADQRAMVVPRVDLVHESTAVSATPAPLTIHTVDIATGAVRVVGRSTVTATSSGRGWQIPAFGAAVGPGPLVRWATISFDQQGATLGDLTVGGADGSRTVATTPTRRTSLWWLSSLRVVQDRELRIGDQLSVDLETGTISDLPPMSSVAGRADPLGTTVSPDGTYTAEVSVVPAARASESPRGLRLRVWRHRRE